MKISHFFWSMFLVIALFTGASFAFTWHAFGGNNYCGDSVARHGEECDDGNALDGDGCDHNCSLEAGFYLGTGGEILIQESVAIPEDNFGFFTDDDTVKMSIIGVIRSRNVKLMIQWRQEEMLAEASKNAKALTYPVKLEETWATTKNIAYLFLSLFGMIGLGFTLFGRIWEN